MGSEYMQQDDTPETAEKRTRRAGPDAGQTPSGKVESKQQTAAGKKPGRPKATGSGKAPGKQAPCGKKPTASTTKRVSPSLPVGPAARARQANTPPAAGETAAEDPRSLSWMSEQAVSALNAVKASQRRQARTLLENAQRQKPPAGKASPDMPPPASTDLAPQATVPVGSSAPANGTSSGGTREAAEAGPPEGAAVPAASGTAGASPVGMPATDRPAGAPETGGMDMQAPPADLPVTTAEPESTGGGNATPDTKPASTGGPQGTAPASDSAVPARPVRSVRTRWLRPRTLVAMLAAAGLLVYQLLPEKGDGDTVSAPPPAPHVAVEPASGAAASSPATAATAPANSGDAANAAPEATAEWVPAPEPVREPPAGPQAMAGRETPGSDTPAVDTPATDIITAEGTDPGSPQPAAPPADRPVEAAEQAARRTAPQPPSRPAGYGYYPRQPARRQPYHRPAYSGYPPR
ncbi:MAG: hypothetical protein PVJ66_05500 [Gammaproteobacteria bacterium]|jgi:hypothetical protein